MSKDVGYGYLSFGPSVSAEEEHRHEGLAFEQDALKCQRKLAVLNSSVRIANEADHWSRSFTFGSSEYSQEIRETNIDDVSVQKPSMVWSAVAIVTVALLGLNFLTYETLSDQISGNASQISSVSSINSQLQSQLSEVKFELSNATVTINSLKQENSQVQGRVSGLSFELNLTLVKFGNLSHSIDLAQGNISSIESMLSSLSSFEVFQTNYVGNGQAGHNVSVPFAPVLVFMVDYTLGMQATVYFGSNDTSAFFFRGLQLYEADYSYGAGVGAFYHGGLFDLSWVGSAPVGTMNVNGDHCYAIFYGESTGGP